MPQVCGPPALTAVKASPLGGGGGGGGGGLVEPLLLPPHATTPTIVVNASATAMEVRTAIGQTPLTAGALGSCCLRQTTERCIVASWGAHSGVAVTTPWARGDA